MSSPNTKADGGLANTEDLSSYAASLGGQNVFSKGLSYRIGYAQQAAAIGNEDDESRYSVSLGYKHQFTEDLNADFISEHMHIDHLTGEAAHDRAYTTAALQLNYQGWNVGGSYTYIMNDAGETDEAKDGNIMQVSTGYNFDNGLGVHVGYQRKNEEREVTERLGAMVQYSYNF